MPLLCPQFRSKDSAVNLKCMQVELAPLNKVPEGFPSELLAKYCQMGIFNLTTSRKH